VLIDLNARAQGRAYRAKNPLARVPALELDDGRVLCETRAICTYLEGLVPEPNLMGEGFEERAFIEMADRRRKCTCCCRSPTACATRIPALAVLEQPQFSDFGVAQSEKMREASRWLDGVLAGQPYVAGERSRSPTSRRSARWSSHAA
jgi:glutathione S-transferase